MTPHELAFAQKVVEELRDYKPDEIKAGFDTHRDGWLDACNQLLYFIHQLKQTL